MIRLVLKALLRAAYDWGAYAIADTRELWAMVSELVDDDLARRAAERHDQPAHPMPDPRPPRCARCPFAGGCTSGGCAFVDRDLTRWRACPGCLFPETCVGVIRMCGGDELPGTWRADAA